MRGAPEVQALVLRVAAGIAGPGGAVFAEGSVAGAGGATAPGRPMPVPLPDPPPAASDVPTLCATQPLPRDPELLGLGGDVLTRLVASALAPMSAVVTLEADAAGLRLIACAPQPMSLAQVAAAMGTLDARGNRSALVAAARGGTARRRASAGGWASAAARAYLATGQVLRARDDSDDATLLARARARVLPWAWRAARSPRPG